MEERLSTETRESKQHIPEKKTSIKLKCFWENYWLQGRMQKWNRSFSYLLQMLVCLVGWLVIRVARWLFGCLLLVRWLVGVVMFLYLAHK